MLQTRLTLGAKRQGGEMFGQSVAVSDDGRTVLVGAPGRMVHGMDAAGAAEVFRFASGGWSHATQLDLGAGAQVDSNLGWAAALSADGHTALLGAPCWLGGAADCSGYGAPAEVFRFHNGRWTLQAALRPGPTDHNFGASVALSARGNMALIGSGEDGAKAFRFVPGRWTGPTTVAAPSTLPNFGDDVALSADGNTAMLGPCLYTYSSGGWQETAQYSPGGRCDVPTGVALSGDGKTALLSPPWAEEPGDTAASVVSLATDTAVATLDGGFFLIEGRPGATILPVALSRDGTTALFPLSGRPMNALGGKGGLQTDRLLSTGWGPEMGFSLPQTQIGDHFGASVAEDAHGTLALVGAPGVGGGTGAVYALTPNPRAVVVTVSGSGVYGKIHRLVNLPPNDPLITYVPSGAESEVKGLLRCAVAASPWASAYDQPPSWQGERRWYDFSSCSGLFDPGRPLVYDYVNSKYYVSRAPVSLTYTGPTSIRRGSAVTLSARLVNRTSGRPISGSALNFRLSGSPGTGCDSTSPGGQLTNLQGIGSCVIRKVRTRGSTTTATVAFGGSVGDWLPGHASAVVKILG